MMINTNGALKALVVVALFIGVLVPVTSCKGESNKFKQPKFVKEWEVKEVIPGANHKVLGITVNKNGVFALVEANEYKTSPPKKWADMTDEEKKRDISKMKTIFGKVLSEEERIKRFDIMGRQGNIYKYKIQQFDFNGSFINQWPDDTDKLKLTKDVERNTKEIPAMYHKEYEGEVLTEDSRYKFIQPSIIKSDSNGNIIVADYLGNKVVRFDNNGVVTGMITIEHEDAPITNNYDYLEGSKGLAVKGDKTYLVSEPYGRFAQYRLGTLDMSSGREDHKTHPLPKVNPAFPIGVKFTIPLYKSSVPINALDIDDAGNYYLLAGMKDITKYDKDFKKVRSFAPVLKEGFDTDVTILDPKTKKTEKYDERFLSLVRGFNSQKGASYGNGNYPSLYDLNGLAISPQGELFVTFTGQKPFGVMEAIVYDLNGKMLGYWKVASKSESEWFKGLNDLARIDAYEYCTDLAFHGNEVFVGKTISYNMFKEKGIIQRSTKNAKVGLPGFPLSRE